MLIHVIAYNCIAFSNNFAFYIQMNSKCLLLRNNLVMIYLIYVMSKIDIIYWLIILINY